MQKTKNRNLLLARIAVSVLFFSNGAVFANWLSRIPEVKTMLELSESMLGLALMSASVGVILGLLITSGLIARFGSNRVSAFAAIGQAVVAGFLALASDFFSLAGILFFLGLFTSIMDVAMNTGGAEVEAQSNKQIMSSFHGFWSLGLFAGLTMGSAFASAGFSFQQHFMVVPIIFIMPVLVSMRFLPGIEGEQNSDGQAAFQFPPRAIWGLGALAFAAGISEGAILDWGGIYLHEIVHTSEATAALGLSFFSATMLLMRFAGDIVAQRVGASLLVRIGGIAAVFGIGLALLIPTFTATVIGYSIAGIGLAVVIPLAFSAAGKIPELPSGRAIAGVATIGYAAFLIGPVVIGFIAEATSLRIALIIVMVLAATMVFSGGALKVGKSKAKA